MRKVLKFVECHFKLNLTEKKKRIQTASSKESFIFFESLKMNKFNIDSFIFTWIFKTVIIDPWTDSPKYKNNEIFEKRNGIEN